MNDKTPTTLEEGLNTRINRAVELSIQTYKAKVALLKEDIRRAKRDIRTIERHIRTLETALAEGEHDGVTD